MKICILVFGFPPTSIGGTELATYNIAKYLSYNGHEVHVITTLEGNQPKDCFENGFYIHRRKTFKTSFINAIYFGILSILLIRKINPDIIHNQSVVHTSLTCFFIKQILNKPYIIYCRGGDINTQWPFKREILTLAFSESNALIALTEHMKKEMQAYTPKNIYVIPNGLDISKFDNISREKIRNSLNINESEKLIIFVGKFRKEKGISYLINAIDILHRREPNIKLMLVGDGPESQAIKSTVKRLNLDNFVIFTGLIPNETIPQYLIASDIFVLPSLNEGFPNVILEAMGAGLPIIASKVSGLSEIITEEENGFLLTPGDQEAIAEKLLYIINNHNISESISKNNRDKINLYSWQNVVINLEKVYQYCIYTNIKEIKR